VDKTIAKYGKVDILVNNAQGGLEPKPLEDVTDELVATALYSGPVASLRFMQACFPYMKSQKSGHIINTSSGSWNGSVANFANYAMAKGAIASLSYAAARDWSKFGLTVNVIFPFIESEPLQRFLGSSPGLREAAEAGIPVGYVGQAERDLGPVIVFIASDASHYLTGHAFYIDGGAANGPR
jgi:3-oxoacyl-[acyl-carrier protein] reductase